MQATMELMCGRSARAVGVVAQDGILDLEALRVHGEACGECGRFLGAVKRMMRQDEEESGVQQQEYFGQEALARKLGVSPSTVRRWWKRGAFPGFAIWEGRRRLYRWRDVEDFLEASKVTGDGA